MRIALSQSIKPLLRSNRRCDNQFLRREIDSINPHSVTSSPLLDKFGRQHTYLRISLTEKCNLRCVYCMPNEGIPLMPKDDALTSSEIGRLARLFVQEGVDKIRLTGGEPTLRKDLMDIMENLSELRKKHPSDLIGLKQIGITTNGLLLTRLLPQMASLGLSHINVSLDTLDPFQFELMTRRPAAGLQKVLDGIDLALQMGIPSVKVNVVVLQGVNDTKDVLQFVRWAKDKPITIRFIEYMPFDGNRWRMEKLVPYKLLIERIESEFGPLNKIKDDSNDTTKHYQVDGHSSSLGFITSMTEHFCGTCNRLRITADGKIKVCLFGQEEVSLRDEMRRDPLMGENSDESLKSIIGAAVGRKHARHGGQNNLQSLAETAKQNRSMIRIGG
ncbi:uncharacterized protein FA14DRAFT_169170 [Meira miltonrushii]|uniref:GTP 3',8-cyclase n=1 Tax=Meira miltonrushii TaxID=1280837 RepID=A0A316V1Y4_9BASI|nr:uncharacterized protein FA14DRAFT_169170 [Meira miltonrushii]PWN31559.1 hypothetical protein FA14DRAFT_169170 [Meira miltonrushii]